MFYRRYGKPLGRGGFNFRESVRNLATVSIQGNSALISFNDGKSTTFSAFWLRDHCKCPKCFHPNTKQRLHDTLDIPRDIKVVKAESKDNLVTLHFSDQHQTTLKEDWLRYHSYNPVLNSPSLAPIIKKILWDKEKFKTIKSVVSYEKVMQGDDELAKWLHNIETYGFSFVEGVPVDPKKTEQLAQRIAFIRETHFGTFWDFTSNLAHGDTAYTTLAIGGHTDSTYFTDPVGLQLFHLLEHRGKGGHTLLVDAFQVAYKLKSKYPQHFKTLTEFLLPSHQAGDSVVHCLGDDSQFIAPTPRACAPLISLNPVDSNEIIQIRFNNHDRSVLSPRLAPIGSGKEAAERLERFYDAWRLWMKMVREDENEVWIQMKPGTAMIVDNWRTLHGRSSFDGYRRLCGAYINMDDYKSRVHMLLHKGKAKEEL